MGCLVGVLLCCLSFFVFCFFQFGLVSLLAQRDVAVFGEVAPVFMFHAQIMAVLTTAVFVLPVFADADAVIEIGVSLGFGWRIRVLTSWCSASSSTWFDRL